MRHLISAVLALTLVLCPACREPEPPAPPAPDQTVSLRVAQQAVVKVLCDGDWIGSGVVVHQQVRQGVSEVFIVTAKHVVEAADGHWEVALSDGWEWHHTLAATVIAKHNDKDLALLRAYGGCQVVAELSYWFPVPLTPAATVGVVQRDELVVNLGTVGAWCDGFVMTTAHGQWGYSGGALFAWREDRGHWELVGIVVQGEVYGMYLMFHQTLCVPIRDSMEWLVGAILAADKHLDDTVE